MELLSVREAATKLKLSVQHVHLLLAKGELAGKKLGHDWVATGLDYKRKRKPRIKRNKG